MSHQFVIKRSAGIVRLLGILLLVTLSLLQAFGVFHLLELNLTNVIREYGPSRLLPESPRLVLISLEHTPRGFSAMDVAMVMRGLKNLSPRCIAINGLIEPEQGPVPFLPTIQSTLSKSGITLIHPQLPSPQEHFQSVPLIRYSLTSGGMSWPILQGMASPGVGDAFFPADINVLHPDSALPLLALTSNRVPIGSLWWWLLPNEIHQRPPLLLFGNFLFLSNHTPLHLTQAGSISPTTGEAIEMPLDDFLLQIEQKEQGTISPTFDMLWNKSTVLIGTHDVVMQASLFATLLQQVAWHHLSLKIQGAISLGCILLLIISRKLSPRHRYFLSALILLLSIILTLLFLHQGIIIPFLPAISLGVLLLLSNKR